MQGYLYLLKKTLTRYPLVPSEEPIVASISGLDSGLIREIINWAALTRSESSAGSAFNPLFRAFGIDWPAEAETMIGLARLDHLQRLVCDVLERGVSGDLAEAGVWRGGASILMRAVLRAFGDTGRTVWLADSFQGLPRPDPMSYPLDLADDLWTYSQLAVPQAAVMSNFERYGLLDSQVRFVPGWFRDTLPNAPVDRLALLRLDGDMYESTIISLESLYHKVSPGGYVVVDDYGAIPACRQAVEDFRRAAGIAAPLQTIDWTGVFWQIPEP